MARSAGTIDVSMPKVVRGFTIRIRFARIATLRLRLATWIFRLGSLIAGVGVEIDTGTPPAEVNGIPLRLSVDDPGYSSALGASLIVRLDGVDQYGRAIGYDLIAGTVTRSCLEEHGNLYLDGDKVATETVRGTVTVDRRA